MKVPKECGHEVLYFGSGGYYVFCSLCNFYWTGDGCSKYSGLNIGDNGGEHRPTGIRIPADFNTLHEQVRKYE